MDLSHFSIAHIKQLAASQTGQDTAFLQALEQDKRIGVQQLRQQLERARCKERAEDERLRKLFWREEYLKNRGIALVAGVDEAGRGPLAGPVMAAAVILPGWVRLSGLNDSKKLTPTKRKALASDIKKVSRTWAVGTSTVDEINQLNIHQAALLAMKRAILGLGEKPQQILVDGCCVIGSGIPENPVVGGDRLCASIAAASILAKVTRDDWMEQYHQQYPQYGFAQHKGYGTAEHLAALRQYGPCPQHRIGFGPVKDLMEANGLNE